MRDFKGAPAGIVAAELVTGDRQESYGDPLESLDRIGKLWGAILGIEINRRQVAHMMVLLKVSRDQHKPNPDNEVDICGYVHLLQFDREDQDDTPVG